METIATPAELNRHFAHAIDQAIERQAHAAAGHLTACHLAADLIAKELQSAHGALLPPMFVTEIYSHLKDSVAAVLPGFVDHCRGIIAAKRTASELGAPVPAFAPSALADLQQILLQQVVTATFNHLDLKYAKAARENRSARAKRGGQ